MFSVSYILPTRRRHLYQLSTLYAAFTMKMATLRERMFIYKQCDDNSTESSFDCTPTELIDSMDEDAELFSRLLKETKDVNARDCKGRTLLHIAASRGRDDIMRILIANGADVSALDHVGNTPLHCCGHIETIECIVSNRVDVFARCVAQQKNLIVLDFTPTRHEYPKSVYVTGKMSWGHITPVRMLGHLD